MWTLTEEPTRLRGFYLFIFQLRGAQRIILSEQESPILLARVANHIEGFGLSSSLPELAVY